MPRVKWKPRLRKKPGPKPGSGRRGRPPTGKNPIIACRWPQPLLAGIDAYARSELLERGVALRQIVALFLTDKGLVDADTIWQKQG